MAELAPVQQVAQLLKEKNLPGAQKLIRITTEADASWASKPEVLIQLARLGLRLGNEVPLHSAKSKAHFEQALEFLVKAEQTSSEVKGEYLWNHLMSCILGKLSEQMPPKEKIKNAFKIQEHALKARELEPNEPGPLNVLGRWSITVSTIGRVARFAAKALFGAPPEATLDDALAHLKKANEVETPESATYVMNLLCLGEVYALKKDAANAKIWYKKCTESRSEQPIESIETEHEKRMRAQARTELAKLK